MKKIMMVSMAALFVVAPCYGNVFKKAAWVVVPYLKNQALIKAAKEGDVVGVKKAIKEKANVKAKDKHGLTAMFYAARNGYAEVVSLLIHAGVNVDDEIFEKETNVKRTGIVFTSTTALIEAARNGHSEVVKVLINAGAYVNATAGAKDIKSGLFRTRGTALTYARYNHHDAVVKMLLDAGAVEKVA